MKFFAGIETFLYLISVVLFYPVLLSLTGLIFWVTLYFGSFLRELVERSRGESVYIVKFKKFIDEEIANPPINFDLEIEKRLREAEIELIKSLDKIRFVIRVGPALGLMGTLIPMGIALSALAQGDLPKMAGSMVTAFTTVVVGLACSVAAYVISMIKERWIRADLKEMEYLAEKALRAFLEEIKSFKER
ncbi:MAG: MotA/TolQ/ExbB proton channel family protein [Caldimicrobium sp.]